MIERNIPQIWVEETIRFPDTTKRINKKYIHNKRLNGFSLEVVFIKKKYIKIITCYYLK